MSKQTARGFLCMNCARYSACLPSWGEHGPGRLPAHSSGLSSEVLNCSSSDLDLELLQSCVTGPCFLWPVQSSLGLTLQQFRVFSAV